MSEIKPALTPEEWQRQQVEREEHATSTVWESARFLGAEYLDAHAVAALALHGQPFGFTWEDIATLDIAVGATAALQAHGWEQEAAHLKTLRARIAALLPPREARQS